MMMMKRNELYELDELSVRSINALRRLFGVETIEQFKQLNREDLNKIAGLKTRQNAIDVYDSLKK